jgi:hypothetical protein
MPNVELKLAVTEDKFFLKQSEYLSIKRGFKYEVYQKKHSTKFGYGDAGVGAERFDMGGEHHLGEYYYGELHGIAKVKLR